MKTCSACGFIDLPSAHSCLRCSEDFPVAPVHPEGDDHSEAYYMLDDLAQACMAGELTLPQRDSLIEQLLKFMEKEQLNFTDVACQLGSLSGQENLKLIVSGLATMSDLLREAHEAVEWSLEEWTAWLDDAAPPDQLVQRGAHALEREASAPPVDTSINPLLHKAQWMQNAAGGNDLGESLV